ncbi:MAG: hypothetical protein IJ769_10875 [Clostridia bacterium]|nr:hypothetical protein [Clostridia bacterium]
MRNTANSTRLRRLSAAMLALLLALAPWARADDLASDLGGGFQAAAPEDAGLAVQVDMESADVVIGYIDPGYLALSPLTCGDWNLVSVNQLVYESVVDFDENMKPIPMLADNWVHDGKTWTFNLRSGIQFHNGYELTAYDVVRSYQTLTQAGSANPYYARLQMIAGMEATDIYVLTVDAKTNSLLTLYAMNFPVMQYETLYDEMPRGTGPYWYIQYDEAGTVRLEANPLWWKQQPAVKSILLKRYDVAGDAIEAIRTNQIDMLSTKSPKASLSRRLSGLTSMDYPTLTYEMLVPNLDEDSSIMADVNVRQAVMFAVDRSIIASNGYLDMAIQCEVPVVPTSWLYESQSAIYYYSPERALQLMHNAGWVDMTGNGKLNRRSGIMLEEPSIRIVTYNEGTNSMRENAANLIKEYLEAVGFNVRVSVLSQEDVRDAVRHHNYDLALIGVNLSEVPDISAILESGGDLNYNRYSNEAMDQLIQRARSASDEATLQKVYSDIQMTVVQRLPILGLLFRTGTVLSTRSIGGLTGLRAYDNFNGFEFLQE